MRDFQIAQIHGFDKFARTIPLTQAVAWWRSARQFGDATRQARQEFEANGKTPLYDSLKAKNGGVTAQISDYTSDKRTIDSAGEMSGLCFVDYDGIDPGDVKLAFIAFTQIPEVVCIKRSASGVGLHAFIAVDPIPTHETYDQCRRAVASYLDNITGYDHDEQGTTGLVRLCYNSHDPDLYFNDADVPGLQWQNIELPSKTQTLNAPKHEGDPPRLDISPYIQGIVDNLRVSGHQTTGPDAHGWWRTETAICHGGNRVGAVVFMQTTMGEIVGRCFTKGCSSDKIAKALHQFAPQEYRELTNNNIQAMVWNYEPLGDALRLLYQRGASLMVVPDDPSGQCVYLERNGVWSNNKHIIENEVRRSFLDHFKYLRKVGGKEVGEYLNHAARLGRPHYMDQVISRGVMAYNSFVDNFRDDSDAVAQFVIENVVRCNYSDLNTNPRYIGAPNGIIDLDTGALLDPQEGRRHLVTCTVADDFDPNARHDSVSALVSHMNPEIAQYLWDEVAYSLRGRPNRRLILLEGPTNGGKTGLMRAIRASLGNYCAPLPKAAIAEKRYASDTGLSPEQGALMQPTRISYIEEIKGIRLDQEHIKDITGGVEIPWRKLREDFQHGTPSATIFICTNPAEDPTFDLSDAPLVSRLKYIPVPPLRVIDPGVVEAFDNDRVARQALVAHLVETSVMVRVPPVLPESLAVTLAEQAEDSIPIHIKWVREHISRDINSKIHQSDAWSAFAQSLGGSATNAMAGGVRQREFYKAIRNEFGLTAAKTIRIPHKQAAGAGWEGLRLSDNAQFYLYTEAHQC